MKKFVVAIAAVALTGAGTLVATATGASAGRPHVPTVLESEVLVGVSGNFVGAANAVRGVPGGGRAWSIASGSVELKANGKLEVSVTGLVLTSTGTNPIANFKATVSCLTTDPAGTGTPTVNVSTDPFPATATGNATFEGKVALPSPCVAPIVFVANGTVGGNGAWFAATGV